MASLLQPRTTELRFRALESNLQPKHRRHVVAPACRSRPTSRRRQSTFDAMPIPTLEFPERYAPGLRPGRESGPTVNFEVPHRLPRRDPPAVRLKSGAILAKPST